MGAATAEVALPGNVDATLNWVGAFVIDFWEKSVRNLAMEVVE
jgi:hypothetical protein